MFIRSMSIDDLSVVMEIERACFRSPWSEDGFLGELEGYFSHCIVIIDNDAILGFALWRVVFEQAHLFNIAVKPGHRNLGLGTALMDHVINHSLQSGATTLFLEVRVTNDTAKSLYMKYGFHPMGIRPRYYEDGEDALVMEKDLSGEDKA